MKPIALGVRNYAGGLGVTNGAALSLGSQVASILRKYGTDAHVYMPGIGVLNGITAGNYLDSAGTTVATVDNPVGKVDDSFGAINATQATTANKPILRYASGRYYWQFDGSNDLLNVDSSSLGQAGTIVIGVNSSLLQNRCIFGRLVNLTGVAIKHRSDGAIWLNVGNGTIEVSSRSAASQYTAGETHVISAIWNISASKQLLRKNKTQIKSDTALYSPLGAKFQIGNDLTLSEYWIGNCYPLIWVNAEVSTQELETLERFVGQLSGVVIP